MDQDTSPEDKTMARVGQWSEIVTLYVGPDAKAFYVHRHIICEASRVFKAAFHGNWRESKEAMTLKSEDPAIVSGFLSYLYSTRIPRDFNLCRFRPSQERLNGLSVKDVVQNILKIYYLADVFLSTAIKDRIMDQLEIAVNAGFCTPSIDMIKNTFENVKTPGGIQAFCIDRLVIKVRMLLHEGMSPMEERGSQESDSEQKAKELSSMIVHGVLSDDIRLATGFITELIFIGTGPGAFDYHTDPCRYHSHTELEGCHREEDESYYYEPAPERNHFPLANDGSIDPMSWR